MSHRSGKPTRWSECKCVKKYASHFPVLDLHLGEPLEAATPRVEEDFLPAGFDEGAWSETIHDGRRTTRAQERHLNNLPLCANCGEDDSEESDADEPSSGFIIG